MGDKIYGGDEELYLAFVEGRLTSAQWEQLLLPNHALHARSVRFSWRNAEYNYRAEPDSNFNQFLEGVPPAVGVGELPSGDIVGTRTAILTTDDTDDTDGKVKSVLSVSSVSSVVKNPLFLLPARMSPPRNEQGENSPKPFAL